MKDGKQPWMKFYPADWRAEPSLRVCSLAARGLWMEMLGIMHDAEPRGSLLVGGREVTMQQLSALVGAPSKVVVAAFKELDEAGVFSREGGTIFSRRIRRDVARQALDTKNGFDGGSPDIRRGAVPKAARVRPYKKSDAPEKTKRIFAKTDGKCYWCGTKLIWGPSTEVQADGFHVDHVLPVCDGGTNDEGNLVPACAVCNHDRAKVGWPLNSRRRVDPTLTAELDPTLSPPEIRHQSPEARSQKLEARGHTPDPKSKSSLGSDAAPAARDRERDFDRFWQVYPKRTEIADARRALDEVLDAGVPIDDIVAGARRFAPSVAGREERFVMSPVRWLRGERWKDGLKPNGTDEAPASVFVRNEDPRFARLANRHHREHGAPPKDIGTGGRAFPAAWVAEVEMEGAA